jgi:chromosome segregation ATPase
MSRSGRSLGTTSAISEASTRPPTALAHFRAQDADVKPSEVHDLKLQTQQVQQRTLVLRTQLKRMEFQIHSKTNAINKTFEQASERPQGSHTIHANTIPNLRRNIEGARNALESLREQIEQCDADDRTSAVEELEEETKMTFCEHRRLAEGLQKQTEALGQYTRELQDCEARASPRHIADLRALIRDTRAENATLREKATAYQLKIEKLDIEDRLAQCQKADRSIQEVVNEAERQQAELNDQIRQLSKELQDEEDDHKQNVARLKDIIQSLKDKIAARLAPSPGVKKKTP